MPQKKNNQGPPSAMTWTKALPVLVVAIVFDALRFMFNMFWFFGPALAGLYCANKVGDVAVIGKLLTTGCVAGATALGVAGAPAIEAFGVIMAMAVGLFGWLIIGLMLMMTNARIFKVNAGNALRFVTSLLISEVPFIGSFPAFTVAAWRMYHHQIKKEKKILKKYEKEQAEEQFQERNQQTAELMQVNAAGQSQDAANEEMYNDEEIPDDAHKAA